MRIQKLKQHMVFISIASVVLLLMLLFERTPVSPSDIGDNKKTILQGVFDTAQPELWGSLTYYTFPRGQGQQRSTDVNTAHFREAVKHEHLKNFVKPKDETCEKRFPTCIIVGVDKCGTREILEFLYLHPLVEVFFGRTYYEMDYFGSNYSKGEEWFRNEMPCSYSNQMTIMKHSTYFYKEGVPKRMYDFNPKMKLILMVREPVSRTISRYMFEQIVRELEPSTALEHVIFKDGVVNKDHNIVGHSAYDEAMKKWLQYFSLSQIMIVETEELKNNPADVLRRAEQFLGLPQYITPETFIWNKEKGYFCIRTDLYESGMSCYGNERGKRQIQINPKTEEFLKEYFKPKSENFFQLIGKSYDWN